VELHSHSLIYSLVVVFNKTGSCSTILVVLFDPLDRSNLKCMC